MAPKRKEKFNIDRLLPPDHIVTLIVKMNDFIPYSQGVNDIQSLVTKGGVWLNNRKTTWLDSRHPFMRVNVMTPLDTVEKGFANASFIVEKLNLYVLAYTEKGKWWQFENPDCIYSFCNGEKDKEFEYAKFSLNYARGGGLSMAKIGLGAFRQSILCLHFGTGDPKTNVHSCCIYVSESPRFKCYNLLICSSLTGNDGVVDVPKDISTVYKHWEDFTLFYGTHLFDKFKDVPTNLLFMLDQMNLIDMKEFDDDEKRNKVPIAPEKIEEIISVLLHPKKDKDILMPWQSAGAVQMDNAAERIWSYPHGAISKNFIIIERIEFWKERIRKKESSESDSDVWRTIKDIIEVAHEDKRVAGHILENKRLVMINKFMSKFRSEKGRPYNLPDEVLSFPKNIAKPRLLSMEKVKDC